MKKYSIGVDFGTLSGRAVIVDTENGKEITSSVMNYPHAVIDEYLPTGEKLGPDWALQDPQDYLDVISFTVKDVIKKSGIATENIVGIGIDFTACTLIPIKADGTPLSFIEEFKRNPHAYTKLWKHHAAQDEAVKVNQIANERNEPWLKNYGGKISSEWAIPKIWQVLDEAPEIYEAADKFIEAADWMIWQLCGKETRNSCIAGYKAMWNKNTSYPSTEFFKALDPRLENVVKDKLDCEISPIGSKAGEITEKGAALTGLAVGTSVAVANVDAHVCLPSVGIDGPGKLLMIMGTSSCHIVMGDTEIQAPGICGVVADGVLPGFYGYEAGQSCVGDHFAWFTENCIPAEYKADAENENKNIHAYLRAKAEKLKPGESGLIALDWWNGNRSVLVDADLTGLMIGMTLQTKPEEMYRALIEATAYGTKVIIDNYRKYGIPIDEIYVSGGISRKDPMCMQIYSDVLNMPIKIAGIDQGPALGSAIFGAVAGKGHPDIFKAIEKMGKVENLTYSPIAENVTVYEKLYNEYVILHDYFGRGGNDIMKRLKNIKKEARGV